MFNPVKKVKLPLRPTKPSTPANYSGPTACPYATNTVLGSDTIDKWQGTADFTKSPPTSNCKSNQFAASSDQGGFGGYTMGLL